MKDITIVTAYIQSNKLLHGTFFNTIDKAYEIACEFVNYYEDNLPEWNPIIVGLEFDEAIEKFCKKYTI